MSCNLRFIRVGKLACFNNCFSSMFQLFQQLLFFNVFMNDLFYFLKGVCINAYADDEQIYASDKDPVKLGMKLHCQLLEADQWLGMNGIITNPDKYQAMILGNTNYTFSFTVTDINIPVKDDIELLGVNIDNNLQFNSHVKNKGQQSN